MKILDFDQMNSRGPYPWTCCQLDGANVVGLEADRNSRHRPITHLRSKQRNRSLPHLAPRAAASLSRFHSSRDRDRLPTNLLRLGDATAGVHRGAGCSGLAAHRRRAAVSNASGCIRRRYLTGSTEVTMEAT